jgi:DNA-binding response OmpR family regulator
MSKIVIAVSNHEVAEIHRKNFFNEGLEAFIAFDRKDIMDIVNKEKIDILLVGKDLNGFEISEEIRKNNPNIKIFIVGVGDSLILKENQKKAVESGANDFIDVVHIMPDNVYDIVMGRMKNE